MPVISSIFYQIAYQYLCHLEEAKKWMERCLGEELPPTTELEESMRNGVILVNEDLNSSNFIIVDLKGYFCHCEYAIKCYLTLTLALLALLARSLGTPENLR